VIERLVSRSTRSAPSSFPTAASSACGRFTSGPRASCFRFRCRGPSGPTCACETATSW
jgi:hypothetical protein